MSVQRQRYSMPPPNWFESRDSSSSAKPQWLLIKHRDEFATEEDVVAENMSIASEMIIPLNPISPRSKPVSTLDDRVPGTLVESRAGIAP